MVEESFLIKDVRVFDGENYFENGFVHVQDGIIKSVGTNLPETISTTDLRTISRPGHTVLPGFIDAHNHGDKGNGDALYQNLRFGVTTIMDLHNEIPYVRKLKKIAREEVKLAADFKCAGVAATVEDGWPESVVTAHDKSPEVSQELNS